MCAQFHWNPETYLEEIRAEVPRYDELQRAAVDAIPFAPDRVLELGMGTGETTRVLLEAYPDAWVIGLDSSPDMVYRLREEYDDVQLARMEDPLPDGPWDLVISVLSVHHLKDDAKRTLFRRVREQSRALVIGDVVKADRAGDPDRAGLRLPRHSRSARRVVRRRDHLDRRRPGRRPSHLRQGGWMTHHNPERPGPPPSADEGVVLYEKRDRIAYVTINRPEARNAVSPEVHRAMIAAWADFAEDDSVDVAILTGAGEAFCAGADLKEYIPPIIAEGNIADIREIAELGLNGFTRGQHRIYKPIIGAINGWALAGGLETALACDIRIASDRAMFGSFEARRGFHHGDGGIVRLVNTCGTGIALEMLLTAEPIDAQRALQCNLVSRVVPHERLMEEAESVAHQILRNSQRAVRSAKQTILDTVGKTIDEQLRNEAWNAYSCADPKETSELLGRFYEKTDAGRAGSHETGL